MRDQFQAGLLNNHKVTMSKVTSSRRGKSGFAAFSRYSFFALLFFASPPISFAQEVHIGVIQSVSNWVLNQNLEGFEAALSSSGFKPGVDVIYDRQITDGDPARADAIVRKFNGDKVDLIFSIGTPATQAVIKVPTKIPLVFSSVTDPVAAGIVPKDSSAGKATGTKVTGMSDYSPVLRTMEVYAKLIPQVKRWGALFNPAEINSAMQIKAMQEAAGKLGLELTLVPVANRSEVRQAAESLVGRVQAIVLPYDNTVSPNSVLIGEVCEQNRIALFAGVAQSARNVSLAAYSVDYFLVGYAAGKKASLVLKGADPGTIPWDSAENFKLVVSQRVAKSLGIRIPADMLKIADRVIE